MQVAVQFGEERLEFELPADQVVGQWHGPPSVSPEDARRLVAAALEGPIEYPPLRQAVVPGDRVAIPVEPDLPCVSEVLSAVVESLEAAGVERETIEVVTTRPPRPEWEAGLPARVAWSFHDPSDRSHLAYLANTPQGRRVYLNRVLTDADCVIPIGRLAYDPVFGYRGPWAVVFPDLSDDETQRAYRGLAADTLPHRDQERPAMAESSKVSWLLGSQFHVGLVEGVGGLARAVAGLEPAVRQAGMQAVDETWGFQAEHRAELVVAGIGRPGVPVGISELAEGLATAARLVQRGGKIVVLSRAAGSIGPAMRRLADTDNPRPGPGALRGLKGETDYPAALQLADALSWADIYLLSSLDESVVDDLAMIALSKPEEARKLAASAGSCLFLSQAELTRAQAAD